MQCAKSNEKSPELDSGHVHRESSDQSKWRSTTIRGDSAFRPSCREILQARRGKHLHRLAAHYGKFSKGISVPSLSQFFPVPPQIMGGTSDSPSTESGDFSSDAIEVFLALPAIYAVTEETSSGVHIRPARENEELTNWTAVPLYSAIVADV
ncbi:hypothetical protein CRG98_021184 [Punica granatum]|uniref:Uncharacterized protein n=2 Tax=Punica granatum TaxID=22663 RepID=A0A2I0JSH6_PUNGR|nr:hypothetical protein CRG98_021184 [Punica granatum]